MAENKQEEDQVDGGFKAFYIRQFISLFWMLAGLGTALLIREQNARLQETIDFPTMALIGGAVGIVIPNVRQFRNAGRLVTRHDNEQLNIFVGAGITLVLLLVFSFIVSWLVGA